jgi:hypothetical protein
VGCVQGRPECFPSPRNQCRRTPSGRDWPRRKQSPPPVAFRDRIACRPRGFHRPVACRANSPFREQFHVCSEWVAPKRALALPRSSLAPIPWGIFCPRAATAGRDRQPRLPRGWRQAQTLLRRWSCRPPAAIPATVRWRAIRAVLFFRGSRGFGFVIACQSQPAPLDR